MNLCNECKMNEATITTIRMVDGEKKTIYLCPKCAAKSAEKGKGDEQSNFLPFTGYFTETKPRDRTCPKCKTPLSSFSQTGYIGCQECYVTFEPEIRSFLERMQGGSAHIGKSPITSQRVRADYTRLSREYTLAVRENRIEDALKIKNTLKKLGNRPTGGM